MTRIRFFFTVLDLFFSKRWKKRMLGAITKFSREFSVDKLSLNWAKTPQEIYNFKVAGFNALTVLTIATLALSIITSSMLLVMLTGLTLYARNAFMRSIASTGALETIRNFFQIGETSDRQMVRYQIFDFVIWMNPITHT